MRDGADESSALSVEASEANAVILGALGTALVSAMAAMIHFHALDWPWLIGLAPFVLVLAAILLVFGVALSLRSRPVFEVDEAGVAMPVGLLGLARLPWEAVAAWGIAERRVPWLPMVRQRVFAVWLRDRGAAGRRAQREIAFNRMMLGADLVLSDWFVPRGFEAILLTCRAIRPELERAR